MTGIFLFRLSKSGLLGPEDTNQHRHLGANREKCDMLYDQKVIALIKIGNEKAT